MTGSGDRVEDETFREEGEGDRKALKVNAPAPGDPVEVLARVGGAEMGGIAGALPGGSVKEGAGPEDGFISTAGRFWHARLSRR